MPLKDFIQNSDRNNCYTSSSFNDARVSSIVFWRSYRTEHCFLKANNVQKKENLWATKLNPLTLTEVTVFQWVISNRFIDTRIRRTVSGPTLSFNDGASNKPLLWKWKDIQKWEIFWTLIFFLSARRKLIDKLISDEICGPRSH